jgi:hypothetical protein
VLSFTHDAAERLEPERIAQPGEKLASAVVPDDVFGDSRSELLHSLGEPRDTSAVQRQVSESRTFHPYSDFSLSTVMAEMDLARDSECRSGNSGPFR